MITLTTTRRAAWLRPVSFARLHKNLHTLVALALVPAVFAVPAGTTLAQENEADVGIDEIIVTARRREESIQETPLSITAFGMEELQRRSFTTVKDVADATPNMMFTYGGAASSGQSTALAFIRGIGQGDFLLTTDPGVGIYIDGVYLGRMTGGIFDLVDLERIEVLRGPQGTLFGRNTVGGAINAITALPSEDFGGMGRVTVGDFDRIDVEGVMNIPLTDTLYSKISFASRDREGYIDRPLVGDKTQDVDRQTFRGQLRWLPNDDVDVVLTGDYTRERATGASYALVKFRCEPGPYPNCVTAGQLAEFWNRLVGVPQGLGLYDDTWEVDDLFTSFGTNAMVNNSDVWGVSATIDWQLSPNLSIKSITAYREQEVNFTGDADASPLPLSHNDVPNILNQTDQDQFSQEIQLNGLSLNDRLNWIVGLYYFVEDARDDQPVRVAKGMFDALENAPVASVAAPGVPAFLCPGAPAFPLGPCFGGAGNPFNALFDINFDTFRIVDNTSWAVFGQGTLQFSDKWSATAGVRFSHEEKDFRFIQFGIGGNPFLDFEGDVSDEWESWSPRLGFEYQASEDAMIYAAASKGFKTGGFNGRPVNFTSLSSFDPEEVWSYEVGAKTTWLDNRLLLNISGFFYDYEDIQLTSSQSDPATGALAVIVENAGDAELKGFEFEFIAQPTDQLQFSGGVGYLDFEYTKLLPQCGTVPATTKCTNVQSTDTLPHAPELTVNFSAQFAVPTGNAGELIFRVDYLHVDKYYQEPLNAEPIAEQGYDRFNGRITYAPADGDWDLSLWGTNLTDETFFENGFDVDAFGDDAVIVGEPRMWGATLSFRFD